jgi:hypothetical protein
VAALSLDAIVLRIALTGSGGGEGVDNRRKVPFGDRTFDLLGKGTDLAAIVGAKGDVEEAEPVGDEAGDGEVATEAIDAVETLAGCEERTEACSSRCCGYHR